jgi:hypothetical protein
MKIMYIHFREDDKNKESCPESKNISIKSLRLKDGIVVSEEETG